MESSESPTPEVAETPKEPDILSRVTNFVEENKPVDPPVEEGFKPEHNSVTELEIPEEAKKYLEEKEKSLVKGFQQKYAEIAEMRKDVLSVKEQLGQSNSWTPERVQSLVNDPEFVKAAQQVAGTTEEEYSNLSDSEKAEINQLKAKLTNLEKSNLESRKQAQDVELAQKYSNYNPQAIDTVSADLIAGKRQATREDLYWAVYGKENAVNAYKLGLKDAQNGNIDKINSSAVEGATVSSVPDEIVKEEGETDRSYFRRINQKVLSKIKK